jgi:hypothetical protein
MNNFHPEFGRLCPTPRLRRDVRLAFLALMFGAVIGSVTVAALSTDRKAETAGVENARMTATQKPPEAAIRSNYQVETSSRAADSSPAPLPVPFDNAQTNLNAYESQSSLNAQSRRVDENLRLRRLRPVKNAPAPEIARLPLGHPTALEQPTSMGPPAVRTSEAQEPQTLSQVAHASAATSEPPASEHAVRDSGPRKKPNRVARAQNRQHREKSDRVATVRRNWDNGFRGLGRAYAFDGAYGRTGFWYWSR